jgi:hypothetical protein
VSVGPSPKPVSPLLAFLCSELGVALTMIAATVIIALAGLLYVTSHTA